MDSTEQIQLARQILEYEYTTAITVEQLSNRVALSRFHLIRRFCHAYRQTPHQYLIHLRINKAKDLLVNSELSITDICFRVGYESLGSFSTLFCKTVGIPPSAYRQSGQNIREASYIPLCNYYLHDLNHTLDP
ncbi:MAG: AraC family transcriptional regulator [Chloroflexota bacterium]